MGSIKNEILSKEHISQGGVDAKKIAAYGLNGSTLVRLAVDSDGKLETSGGSATFLSLTDTPSAYTSQGGKSLRVAAGETAIEFFTPTDANDAVGIDAGATPGYIGAASSDGVLRVDATLDYTDGGDYITLGLDATLKSNYDTAYSHSQDNTQAHSDYLINNGDDSTSGTLTAAGFAGPLTGNVTGNVSGSSGSCTGESATVATIAGLAPNTATTQATQPNITTCANLTTVGTIGTGVWQGTAVDGAYVDLEGTELKSTGEAGGTKYLREDGDGTCSWQAVAGGDDEKVGVDSAATPDYIGAASGDGVLRVDATLDYTDGGNFVTLGLDSTLKTNYDAASAHVSADGSSHTFLDQSVVSGATPTFTATNITGLPAASVLAGTFGTGAYVFDNTVTGITALDCDEIANVNGDLKIMPDATGDAIFFGDTDVGDGDDGKALYVHRKAAEGDYYIKAWVANNRVPKLLFTNTCHIDSWGVLRLNYDAANEVRCFEGSTSGENRKFTIDGYITAAGASKYFGMAVDDTDDRVLFTREDSNITGLDIQMPLITDAITASGLISADAGQIKFPATANPSADANTLDDYEEGTWTPTLLASTTDFDSVTYDSVSGYYVKIGSMVYISGRMKTDAITVGSAAGNLRIGGLPFTCGANGGSPVAIGNAIDFDTLYPTVMRVVTASATIAMYGQAALNEDASLLTYVNAGTAANDNDIRFSGCYQV